MATSKQLGWTGVLNVLAGTQNLGQTAAANIYAGLTTQSTGKALGAPTLSAVHTYRATAAAGAGSITVPITTPPTPGNELYLVVNVSGNTSDPGIGVPAGWLDPHHDDAGISNGQNGVWLRDVNRLADGTETTVTVPLISNATTAIEAVLVEIGGWLGSPTLDYDGAVDGALSVIRGEALNLPAIPFRHQVGVILSAFGADNTYLSALSGTFANTPLTMVASASGRTTLGYALIYPVAGEDFGAWTWTTPAYENGDVAGATTLVLDVLAQQSAPTALDLIGALNVAAGNGSDPKRWVGLNAVCNQIAGTHNLEALQALQIKAGLT